MEHFYENIEGMFDYDNFYKLIVEQAPSPATFVEVGVYRGRSAAFMAVEIINSGKDIKLHLVDPFDGRAEPGHGYRSIGQFEEFLNRMEPVKDHINVLRLPSLDAAATYPDQSLDFVYIDAEHTYAAVKQDIMAWLPKVKPGGILAGHDYRHGAEFGPMVCVAVSELLPEHTVFNDLPGISPVWVYTKPNDDTVNSTP